jgi:hypothetical protein
MSEIPFHLTIMGRRFIEGTVPQLVDEISLLNKKIDALNKRLDRLESETDNAITDLDEVSNT